MTLIENIKRVFGYGYDGAEQNRHHKYLPAGRRTPKDEDHLIGSMDRGRLRQVCVDLRRNDAVIAGVVERFADNVVGSGIAPQCKTSNPEWNDMAEMWWYEWSKVSDLRQRVNMREMQRLIIQQRMISGDVGFVLVDNGQLQPVEAERIATPDSLAKDANIIEGVKVDPKTGISLGYYVLNRDKDGVINTATSTFEYVPRENFIFCAKSTRFDMVRGIPELAPVVNSVRYIQRIQNATLEKAEMDAMNAWFIPNNQGIGPGNLGPRSSGNSVGSVVNERFESGRTYYGRREDGPPISLASQTPNPQYKEFIQLSLRIVGSALCLPYEFLLLDFSQGSYSSSRAALLQTYRTFTNWQEWLVSNFLQRTWNWRIAKAIKAGQLPQAPVDDNGVSEWYKVEWSFPEYGWVDPQSEAQANQIEWNMGVNTISGITRKKGRDAEDVLREKGMDIATAQRVADDLNAKFKTQLTWRDLISTTMPGSQVAPPKEIKKDDSKTA